MKLAEKLLRGTFTARGVDVILDDRDERPGVEVSKIPNWSAFPSASASAKNRLAKGEVELKPRNGTRCKPSKPKDAVEAW